MNLSQEELTNMVCALGEAERNPFLASRIYAQRFPGRRRRHPDPRSFEKLRERYEKRERARNEDNEFIVLASVVGDPHTSTRKISRELLDISRV